MSSSTPRHPAGRAAVALVAAVTVIVVALAGLLAPAASALPALRAANAVAAIAARPGLRVGVHEPVPAGQRRARAPSYDQLVVGSCVAPEDGAAANVFYHGTDLASAKALAAGTPLDAAAAAAQTAGAEPGFYLATSQADAEYFASIKIGLNDQAAVLRFTMSDNALEQLLGSNSVLGDIPQAGAKLPFEGQQLVVPTEDFPLFNELRLAGEITP